MVWSLQSLDEALIWVRKRNGEGIRCIIHPQGEYSRSDTISDQNLGSYIETIEGIERNRSFASVSIKPTTIGASYDRQACKDRIRQICKAAKLAHVPIELDMEATKYVPFTLYLSRVVHRFDHDDVTIALQSYLDRTLSDLEKTVHRQIKVRLVKGAYAGNIAEFHEVQDRMMDLVAHLHPLEVKFSVGTHDPLLIERIKTIEGIEENIEFGMLLGLGDKTKLILRDEGYSVAEYVPFGPDDYAYILRRENYLRKLKELGLSPCP